MNIHNMWDAYPEIKQDLTSVLDVIDTHITLKDKQANQAIKSLLYAGGKLLRPAFFLLFAKASGNLDHEKAIHIAASIEVLHMATLIHDDIIDEANFRRGTPTLNDQFGVRYALYAGDYLFAVCFKILAKHAEALSTIEFNTSAIERILVGELDQMNRRYDFDVTVKQYLSQIRGKTATLFSLSTALGARLGNFTKTEQSAARKIGLFVGMAFQILDDILDYTEDFRSIGKPTLEDMKQGVYSLPLIYGLSEAKEAFVPHLEKKALMDEADNQAILQLIHQYQGVEKSKELAGKYTKKALSLIEKLPQSKYTQQMSDIVSELLEREK